MSVNAELPAMHQAANSDDVDALRELLTPDNVDERDSRARTSLLIAACANAMPCARLLIDNKADVNAAASCRQIPLHGAAGGGHVEMINFLAKHGADINSCKNFIRTTPTFLTAQSGFTEAAKALVELGADVNLPDSKGVTPLSIAILREHWPVARVLLDSENVDVNAGDENGCTPLIEACRVGNDSMARELVARGANPRQATLLGDTPIFVAAKNGRTTVVRTLVELKVNPHAQDAHDGRTPLLLAAQAGCPEVVDLLVKEFQADIHYTNRAGASAIFVAAENGNASVVRTLVELGADVCERRPKDECAPLHIAALEGHLELARVLVEELGADVGQPNAYGQSPMLLAARRGHNELVRYFGKTARFLVHSADFDGFTPLLVAVAAKHVGTVRLLVQYGAMCCNMVPSDGPAPVQQPQSMPGSGSPYNSQGSPDNLFPYDKEQKDHKRNPSKADQELTLKMEVDVARVDPGQEVMENHDLFEAVRTGLVHYHSHRLANGFKKYLPKDVQKISAVYNLIGAYTAPTVLDWVRQGYVISEDDNSSGFGSLHNSTPSMQLAIGSLSPMGSPHRSEMLNSPMHSSVTFHKQATSNISSMENVLGSTRTIAVTDSNDKVPVSTPTAAYKKNQCCCVIS